jgi:superfamily II DNA/RNA helicase
MDQSSRIAEFERFKNDEINILVASDVAARGLDVKGVSHVFNYDVPWQPDDYIHRIGRTGRAGMKGIAISLATSSDAEFIDRIEKLTGFKIARVTDGERPARSDEMSEERPKAEEPRAQKPRREPRRAEKPRSEPEPRPKPVGQAERSSPVVEDIKDEWNGPLPSFLSVRAD